MPESSYKRVIRDSTLLEGTVLKPELLEMPNGNYMKFLYRSHFLRPSLAKKYVRKWQQENNRNIKIIKLFRYQPMAAEIICYQKIMGENTAVD